MALTLYTYFRSSAAYRVRIALNLKGLKADQVPVHLVKGGGEQKSEAFRRINPNATVPALEQFLSQFAYLANTLDVLDPGTQTAVQDYPGRLGYWNVGVPPSGPMDSLAFRLANRLVNNPEHLAGLEITLNGPTLRFNCASEIALCGAPIEAFLDNEPLALWQSHAVRAGALLEIGKIDSVGSRVYLAVQGGIQVPHYLGSRSTFMLGQFGGHAGRTLQSGDVLSVKPAKPFVAQKLRETIIPRYTHDWEIFVLYGPHGAPDFFTQADIEQFFATDWKVQQGHASTATAGGPDRSDWGIILQRLIAHGHHYADVLNYTLAQDRSFLAAIDRNEREALAAELSIQLTAARGGGAEIKDVLKELRR